MEFLRTYAKEIVSLLVPILIWFLNRIFQPKSKLAWATPHRFTFLIQEPLIDENGKQIAPSYTVKTGSILIQNIGKTCLDNVEIVFNWKPQLNIWPIRHFEEKVEADNRYVMMFDSLSINEFVQIELIERTGLRDLPDLITVRCKQCVGQNIQLAPRQVVETWKIYVAKTFFWMGIGTSIYLLILLIQFLVLSRPAVLG